MTAGPLPHNYNRMAYWRKGKYALFFALISLPGVAAEPRPISPAASMQHRVHSPVLLYAFLNLSKKPASRPGLLVWLGFFQL